MEFTGTISNAGYYRDCVPTLVITIPKKSAIGFPYMEDTPVPLSLRIGGVDYAGRARSGGKSATIKISADIANEKGEPVRLADVLLENGFQQKQKVLVVVEGTSLSILPSDK